ncbi:MAG: asparagine synthase (glutamine-hydrolyzing) [Desulfatiglans sp.]|jgi:asparagine synthase (glutamine-hydrolysing)|nr:asparagine synthase (glutamine-hydrolyzing) [Desulfatiglans sp.]
MCGICGVILLNDKGRISSDLLKRMAGIVRYRGPDESGIYLDDQAGLGQVRLSIIDLSGGLQPIHNEDHTLWIVYNGEVFNYPELKEELLEKGHRFYTATDTEVVLHLYEEEGPSCLNRLNGQFAIAIWDSRKKELFLARDRVGIRPLFYTVQDGRLLFASEIKSIFSDKSVDRKIDLVATGQVFTFWTTLQGRTVFENIYELPPGHYLTTCKGQVTTRAYWDIPFCRPEEQLDWSEERICGHIQELLEDAIRIRLRADVPVGCYLSGGLDSSGITALVVKNFDHKVRTFGIRFQEDGFDEGVHQNLMVSFLGTDHTEIQATNKRIGECLPDVLWHCEKPLLRTGPVPLYLLSQAVQENGFKVVLTGEGADEVFGGYNIFREAKVRRFWSAYPDSRLRGLLIDRLYPYILNNPRLRKMQQSFFASGLDKTANPFFSHSIRWQNTSKIMMFLSDDFKERIDQGKQLDTLAQTLPSSFDEWDYLAKAQYLEMSLFLSNYLLSSQGDRVAMAHSIEIRLPYLDYRIIEFMGRVPSKFKIKGLNEKAILKKALQGVLPQDITNRPKHPYRAPIKQSLMNKNTFDYTQKVLSDKSIQDAGLFDVKKVGALLKRFERVANPGEVENMGLVGIFSSQVIYDKFIADFPVDTPPISPDLIVDKRSKSH